MLCYWGIVEVRRRDQEMHELISMISVHLKRKYAVYALSQEAFHYD